MAQDVDLSSKEWTDIIFEGKNKEYGAYQLRNQSVRRHNMAMISVVVVIIVALLLSLLVGSFEKEEETVTIDNEQVMASVDTAQDEEEEPEDEPDMPYEEPEVEEVLPEEVLNTVKVTELAIVEDDQVSKEDEIKTQDELKETTNAFDAKDFNEGTDDVTVVRTIKDEVVVEEKKPAPAPEQIFTAVEESPKFPGGDKAMYEFLSRNIRYPEMAAQNNIQGRVTVQFVVEKDGSIGEVKVVRGKDPDLDKEAVRVVKSMPKFIPGKMNGQAVRVWYTLPINFKLQS